MKTDLSVEELLKGFMLRDALRQLPRVNEMARDQNWDYMRYLEELLVGEWTARKHRKQERLIRQSGLPQGKQYSLLDKSLLSATLNKQINGLLEGQFINDHKNVIAFGLPGRGKTHVLCAIAYEMIIRYDFSVRFIPVYRLVQELLEAKNGLKLKAYLKKQNQYDLIILDDIGYVKQSREEMEVLFTFIAECYEERSLMISSNQNFSKWDTIFHDPMLTMAAIDRLVHHSVILEFDGKSFRLNNQ